jgi:hypothetical protein
MFAWTGKEFRTDEMLFKGDGSHCRSVWWCKNFGVARVNRSEAEWP